MTWAAGSVVVSEEVSFAGRAASELWTPSRDGKRVLLLRRVSALGAAVPEDVVPYPGSVWWMTVARVVEVGDLEVVERIWAWVLEGLPLGGVS